MYRIPGCTPPYLLQADLKSSFLQNSNPPNPSISLFKPQPSIKMPSTRLKSSRTITSSQKKCTNQEVDHPRGPRKDKKPWKSPPESPSSSDSASDESEEQVAPHARKQGLDPANCEFTLQHTVYLNGQRIAGTSNSVTLHFLKFGKCHEHIVWVTMCDCFS